MLIYFINSNNLLKFLFKYLSFIKIRIYDLLMYFIYDEIEWKNYIMNVLLLNFDCS